MRSRARANPGASSYEPPPNVHTFPDHAKHIGAGRPRPGTEPPLRKSIPSSGLWPQCEPSGLEAPLFTRTRSSRQPSWLCSLSMPRSPRRPERTKVLISVLHSGASLFEKARACQQLGEVGTAEAVPALARLLADPGSVPMRVPARRHSRPERGRRAPHGRSNLQGTAARRCRELAGRTTGRKGGRPARRLAADPASGVGRELSSRWGNLQLRIDAPARADANRRPAATGPKPPPPACSGRPSTRQRKLEPGIGAV